MAPRARTESWTDTLTGCINDVVIMRPENPFEEIGRLLADDPEQVPVGGNVALVIAPLGHDAEGREVLSWQWKPI